MIDAIIATVMITAKSFLRLLMFKILPFEIYGSRRLILQSRVILLPLNNPLCLLYKFKINVAVYHEFQSNYIIEE